MILAKKKGKNFVFLEQEKVKEKDVSSAPEDYSKHGFYS